MAIPQRSISFLLFDESRQVFKKKRKKKNEPQVAFTFMLEKNESFDLISVQCLSIIDIHYSICWSCMLTKNIV